MRLKRQDNVVKVREDQTKNTDRKPSTKRDQQSRALKRSPDNALPQERVAKVSKRSADNELPRERPTKTLKENTKETRISVQSKEDKQKGETNPLRVSKRKQDITYEGNRKRVRVKVVNT